MPNSAMTTQIHIARRYRCDAARCVQKTHLPERLRGGLVIRIERVQAVVRRHCIDDVTQSLAGDFHPGKIQRLRVDNSVGGKKVPPAKMRCIDVRWGQQNFVEVLAGVGVVIVIRDYAGLRAGCGAEQKSKSQPHFLL